MTSNYTLLGFILGLVIWTSGKRDVQYSGYSLYRVFADTKDKLDFLESLSELKDDIEIDFWNFPSNTEESAEILVSPSSKDILKKALNDRRITFSILTEDIQREIDQELTVDQNVHKSRKRIFEDGSTFDVSKYNSFDNIHTYLNKLPEHYPNLVKLHTIGHSHEGRDLIVVKVGNNKEEGKKPAMWMDYMIHAREWITVATSLYIIDTILYSYQSSQSVKRYLDEIDWYFLPVMNPDGYVHSFTKDRMWRKNRSPHNCTTGKKCCVGVDLNRNFGYHWGGRGASSSRCSYTYAGERAFSEPESTAVRDFVLQHADTIKAFLTYHSYAQMWRHPFAFRKNTFPEDAEELRTLARNAVQSLFSVHGVHYKVGAGGKRLSGVSRDWAKGEAKIKYVFAVEMASRGSGFVAPPRSIVPSGEETWASLTVVADKIIEMYVAGTNVTGTNSTWEFIPPEKPAELETWIVPSTAAPMPSVYIGGGSGESTCDDLDQECAKKYNTKSCTDDLVVRVICKKYCGQCR